MLPYKHNLANLVSSPSNMGDVCPGIGFDFNTVLVPSSLHILIRHFAFEHRLILCLYREVRNALVDLQFFLCGVRKKTKHKFKELRRKIINIFTLRWKKLQGHHLRSGVIIKVQCEASFSIIQQCDGNKRGSAYDL